MGYILNPKEVCKKGKIELKEDPSSLWINGCHHAISEALHYPNSTPLYVRKCSKRKWTKAGH